MWEGDAVVVGCGQAGVSLSYYLKKRDINHIVVERDQPFSAWRTRWDGFHANTPNWMNGLPFEGVPARPPGNPNGFAARDDLIRYFDACLHAVQPPVETGRVVRRARLCGDVWHVEADDRVYRASALAVCSGAMRRPHYPKAAARVPRDVPALHSSEYRSDAQIGTGSVLIVGSASSGVQIARLLCETGRFEDVHIAQSNVLVLPRHVFGVPTHRIIHRLGLFDVRTETYLGRLLYSGLETKGDPIMRPTPSDLSRTHGVTLHGKFSGYGNGQIQFDDDTRLPTDDLTIVWCTGFRPDYGFIEFPGRAKGFHENGYPVHDRGVVAAAPGLYFVGLRYQHTVASHDIYGVARDAEHVAGAIDAHLAARVAQAPAA